MKMEKFKGTPGPWNVDVNGVQAKWNVDDVDGNSVALTQQLQNDKDWSKRDANTRLIAAAPELLEALQETIHEVGHWLSTQKPELKEKIEAAINKALGEK